MHAAEVDAVIATIEKDHGAVCASAAPPSEASRTSADPSLTLSPTLTSTSATSPACGAGTSMAALSLSSVTMGSSGLMRSPGFTCTSMIGTSL